MPDIESYFSGRRVAITGGLGFIGSTLARRLVELGAKVTLIDSMIPTYGGNLFNINGLDSAVRVNVSDVRDRHSFQTLIQDQECLFNLAGQTSHMDSMEDPYTDLDINCRSQLSILEVCRHHNPDIKVVFASTRQIYGRPDYLPVDEDHPVRPVDINGINKAAGEYYHVLYNNVYGVRGSVLRLTNTIGPRMRVKDARQTFVGIWIRLLVEGKPFEVWEGDQLRDFTYVDDVVDGTLAAAARGRADAVYNIGGGQPVELHEMVEMLGSLMGRKLATQNHAAPVGEARMTAADGRLALDELGFEPQVSLRRGLAAQLAWMVSRDGFVENEAMAA